MTRRHRVVGEHGRGVTAREKLAGSDEFQRLHWLRVAFNAIGSATAFAGFLDYYRRTLTPR